MSVARDLEPGSGRIQSLLDFARREGWHVGGSPGGHFRFTKPGYASIYTGSSPSGAPDRSHDAGTLCRVADDAPTITPGPSTTKGSNRPKEVRRG